MVVMYLLNFLYRSAYIISNSCTFFCTNKVSFRIDEPLNEYRMCEYRWYGCLMMAWCIVISDCSSSLGWHWPSIFFSYDCPASSHLPTNIHTTYQASRRSCRFSSPKAIIMLIRFSLYNSVSFLHIYWQN